MLQLGDFQATDRFPIDGFNVFERACLPNEEDLLFLPITDRLAENSDPVSNIGALALSRNVLSQVWSSIDSAHTYLRLNLLSTSVDGEDLNAALYMIASAFRHDFDTAQFPEHQTSDLYGIWVGLSPKEDGESDPVHQCVVLEMGDKRPHTVGARDVGVLLEQFGPTPLIRNRAFSIGELFYRIARGLVT